MSIESQLQPNHLQVLQDHFESPNTVTIDKNALFQGATEDQRKIRERLMELYRASDYNNSKIICPDTDEYLNFNYSDCCIGYTFPGAYHSHPDRELINLIDNIVYYSNKKYPQSADETLIEIV